MSPESHPQNEQNIQKEQQRLDGLDANQDHSIDLGEQREELTQTYLKKVNNVQGRIRDIYKNIEVQKDMRAPHWQKLESVCIDVEGKLLERLTAIDEENIRGEIAAFNASIDEFLISLSSAEKITEEGVEGKEDGIFPLLQFPLANIHGDREFQIDERTRLHDQLKEVQEAIGLDTKELGELAKKEDRGAQPAVVQKLVKHQTELQALAEKIAISSQRITMLNLSATALQAHGERKKGNIETADRLLLKLKETHGAALESMHPSLWKKVQQAEQDLRMRDDLTQFEELLLKNKNALPVAIEKQGQASLGTVDLLDQYRGWGLTQKAEKPKITVRRETERGQIPFPTYLASSRLMPLGRDPLLQPHQPQQLQLGTMYHGEIILLQGESSEKSTELQRPIVIAFRDQEGVVRLQDGSIIQQPEEIRPSTIRIGSSGGRSLENIYLSSEAQKMFEDCPYGSKVVLRDAPKRIQVQSWNAPSVRILTSADLAFASTSDDNLFIRDRSGKTLSIASISTLDKEREEQSRDVLRALDRDPAVRDVMGKTTAMKMNLQSIGELISSGTAKGAEKAAEYVEYARTQARPLLTLLNDPELKTNLQSVKQQLESLKGASFGFALGGIEKEINERIDAIDDMVDVLENDDIRQMCETILDKSKFYPDTWGHWLKTEGPKFLAAIVVATVAIVTIVATFGAATPLWAIAAAGAAGGIVGSELASEGVHLLHHLYDEDVRSGKATYSDRSILGKYFEGQTVIDPATGKERDMSFIFDVANSYAKQFFVSFAITFSTLGVGRWAAGRISLLAQNSKWIQNMASNGGFQRMSQSLGRIKAGYDSIADKSLARKIVMESLQEIGEEGTEAGIQQGLNRIDARLGMLAGFLVVTGQGIRVRSRVRGFSVTVPPSASLEQAQATLQAQLEAEGHAVEIADSTMTVTMWNGEKMEVGFESEGVNQDDETLQLQDLQSLAKKAKNNPSALKDYLKAHDIDNQTRIVLASILLGTESLSPAQKKALIAAHEKQGEIDKLTPGQKTVKGLALMQDKVFSRVQAQQLLDAGLAGTASAVKTRPPPPPPPLNRPKMEQSSVEQTEMMKYATDYGNLTPNQQKIPPDLAAQLQQYRQDGVFEFQCYNDYKGGGYPSAATRSPKNRLGGGTLHDSVPNMYQSRRSLQSEGSKFLKHKAEIDITEALIFRPLYKNTVVGQETYITEEAGVLWGIKKIENQRDVKKMLPVPHKSAIEGSTSNEQTVRISYHLSDRTGYKTNVVDDIPEGRKSTQSQGRRHQAQPEGDYKDQMHDIAQARQVAEDGTGNSGRPGNQVVISIVLPESQARQLYQYFQQNPDMVRPFFVNGSMGLQTFHNPPPFRQWDSANPHGRMLFRDFDGISEYNDQEIEARPESHSNAQSRTPSSRVVPRQGPLPPPPPPRRGN